MTVISETIDSSNKDYFVRSKFYDETLMVRFYKSRLSSNTSNLKKKIIIYVPKDFIDENEVGLVSESVKYQVLAKDNYLESVSVYSIFR